MSEDICIILEVFVLVKVEFQKSAIVVEFFMFIGEILKVLVLRISQGHHTFNPKASLGRLKVLSQYDCETSQQEEHKDNAVNSKV